MSNLNVTRLSMRLRVDTVYVDASCEIFWPLSGSSCTSNTYSDPGKYNTSSATMSHWYFADSYSLYLTVLLKLNWFDQLWISCTTCCTTCCMYKFATNRTSEI